MFPDPFIAGLCDRIRRGDTRAIARAATLVEAQNAAGLQLIATLFPHTGKAPVIGITGPPGVGKSTLTNRVAKFLRQSGRSVGIIAVDPSSAFTKGAILGDRIRMEEHHGDPGVFIRSMATRGRLGGIAASTLDLTLLLDAAGYDMVLVETVGVGQGEIDVRCLADVTVVVLTPGYGDGVQSIKAGIMEIADVFAINKADLPGVDRLETEIRSMQVSASSSTPFPPLCRVIATNGDGVAELLTAIDLCVGRRNDPQEQTAKWLLRLQGMWCDRMLAEVAPVEWNRCAEEVANRTEDPHTAIERLRMRILRS